MPLRAFRQPLAVLGARARAPRPCATGNALVELLQQLSRGARQHRPLGQQLAACSITRVGSRPRCYLRLGLLTWLRYVWVGVLPRDHDSKQLWQRRSTRNVS